MFVVDASVWVSRLVDDDPHHEASLRWLEQRIEAGESLVMPAIAPADIAAAVSLRTGRSDLASRAVALVTRLPNTRLVPIDEELAELAAAIAGELRLGGADALYVALARKLGVPMVTWDREQEARGEAAVTVSTPAQALSQTGQSISFVRSGEDTSVAHVETLPAILLSYRAAIDAALRRSLTRRGGLHDMTRYAMGWSDAHGNPVSAPTGKAVRPALCLFACEATGGSMEQAIPAAVSLELIHSFSLIHDDIQDRDETRHHRPTVWKVWGEAKALDAGNALRVQADLALQHLTQARASPEDALEVATILNEVCLEVIQGQYLDLSYEGRADIGLRGYFEMVSMKTGALIGASLTLGAVLGGGEPHTVRAFKEWGRSLGRLFQIRDDVLGIWGDEDATGKPVGSDIRRRKKTLPVVFAMSRSRAARERIVGTYEQANVSEDDVAAVMEIMEGVRAREYAQGLANEQRDVAMDALSGAEISPEGLRHAEEIADFLATRSR